MKILLEIIKKEKITMLIPWLLGCFLTIVLFQSCVSTAYVPERRTTVVRREVVPPPWAPQYDNVEQVHYYYLPDIEVYYDVWNHEYVYLHEGNWIYTSSYPTYYSSYDINTAYVVVLDAKVNEPWRTHNLYVSHYPRYYYRSVYDNGGRHREYNQRDNRRDDRNDNRTGSYNGNVRGFNENAKTPIYRNGPPSNSQSNRRYTMPNQNSNNSGNNRSEQSTRRSDTRTGNENRTTTSPGTNPSVNQNSQSGSRRETSKGNENVSAPVRRTDNDQRINAPERRTETQRNTEVKTDRANNNAQNRTTETTQRSQPVVYPSKEVGQPVRVKRDMQPAREERKQAEQAKATQKDDSKTQENTSSRRRR